MPSRGLHKVDIGESCGQPEFFGLSGSPEGFQNFNSCCFYVKNAGGELVQYSPGHSDCRASQHCAVTVRGRIKLLVKFGKSFAVDNSRERYFARSDGSVATATDHPTIPACPKALNSGNLAQTFCL